MSCSLRVTCIVFGFLTIFGCGLQIGRSIVTLVQDIPRLGNARYRNFVEVITWLTVFLNLVSIISGALLLRASSENMEKNKTRTRHVMFYIVWHVICVLFNVATLMYINFVFPTWLAFLTNLVNGISITVNLVVLAFVCMYYYQLITYKNSGHHDMFKKGEWRSGISTYQSTTSSIVVVENDNV